MDMYSSLLATVLITVFSTPALAVNYPVKTNYSVPLAKSVKLNTTTPHLLQKGPIANVININEADTETLVLELSGIGHKRAQAIITYREQNGNFKTVDDLIKVSGISKKILDQNRARITV